mgnify:CR=1 FL=1
MEKSFAEYFAWMMKLAPLVVVLVFISLASSLELFTATGKYDYGYGGVLLPGLEMALIEQEGPGVIDSFQFASDFDGYEDVSV